MKGRGDKIKSRVKRGERIIELDKLGRIRRGKGRLWGIIVCRLSREGRIEQNKKKKKTTNGRDSEPIK